ncbi:NAD(P)-dependent oxidoreductase [Fibrobacter sp.]|uniref:NAD(P)-dependent oxidoreductase n=1 Tax=Fibrobacter sp. TaxID=35828 RepID=UPI00388F11E3
MIIAHNCIRPGAYRGFEAVMDRLHHDMPGTRVASTSLADFDADLRTILREDVESVTLLPYLLLNGQHSKADIPAIVAAAQKDFPQIPITLLPPLGEWAEFPDMVAKQVCKVNGEVVPQNSCYERRASGLEPRASSLAPQASNLFAIEMNLEGRNVLVVGGGHIALRKVKTLLPTGARITVVAPVIDPDLKNLVAESSSDVSNQTPITLLERPYETLDLRGVSLVFICTDQPVVNAQVSNDARARRILVNNACDYLDGDFIVPARMDFGKNITVTVSTQGKSPSLAKKLKQKIQTDWANDLEQLENEFLNSKKH